MNLRFCRSARPIQPGDYVQFAYLPKSMQVTPILVTNVAKNGLVELYGRGWFQPHLLMRVPPAIARKQSA